MAKGGRRQGAGRKRWRERVEDCERIDVRQFAPAVSPGARVAVTFDDGHRHLFCMVEIAHTACGFGGARAWFLCPDCGARVGTLFVRRQVLSCRACHGLAYRSQSLGAMGTAFARLFRSMGALGLDFNRPKGMHERTYLGLLIRAHATLSTASVMVDQNNRSVSRQLRDMGLQDLAQALSGGS